MTPEERAERQERRESLARQETRVQFQADRIELLEAAHALRRCSACASVPHACREHHPARLRKMLLEAARLLEHPAR